MTEKSRKCFTNYQEAESFFLEKSKEQIYVTHFRPDNQEYIVEWWPHKNIIRDGVEEKDEIWVTEAGEPILVQDMTEEQAKDAVRAIIREDKNLAEDMNQALGALVENIVGTLQEDYGIAPDVVVLDQNSIEKKIDSLFPDDIQSNPRGNWLH